MRVIVAGSRSINKYPTVEHIIEEVKMISNPKFRVYLEHPNTGGTVETHYFAENEEKKALEKFEEIKKSQDIYDLHLDIFNKGHFWGRWETLAFSESPR